MKIHLLRSRATKQQLDEMREALGVYVKLAVDIQRGILAGGGALHADCDSVQRAAVAEQTHECSKRVLERCRVCCVKGAEIPVFLRRAGGIAYALGDAGFHIEKDV